MVPFINESKEHKLPSVFGVCLVFSLNPNRIIKSCIMMKIVESMHAYVTEEDNMILPKNSRKQETTTENSLLKICAQPSYDKGGKWEEERGRGQRGRV